MFSTILNTLSKPMIFLVMSANVSWGCFGDCQSIWSSTKGQCGRWRTRYLDLLLGANLLWVSIKLSFRGRRIGGRSTEMEIFLACPRRFLVPVSHLSRWARSRKRKMMPAFARWLSRWQAARCQVSASMTLRTSRANWIHFAQVIPSSSPAGPSMPWITIFHFRQWTSICSVWWARVSAICDMWLESAGRTSVARASRRSFGCSLPRLQSAAVPQLG